ncbi:MAG TPA: carbohydrate ABC transporter permease [Mycobacteriales bacterium]|nr:carbohydrate ABC transporter permease [Mycobacteriales bacterium]
MDRGLSRAAVAVRLLVLLVFLLPVALAVTGSLRRLGLPPPSGLELLPGDPSLSSYRDLGDRVPLGLLLRNSVIVTAVAVPLTVLLASWAGFAMAQLPHRQRRLLVGLAIGLLLVPLPMLWIARFALYLELGMLDTLLPLIAPALAATTPFTVLLAYRAFRQVPAEQWEAARLEGASAVRTWRQVGLPQVRATTTAIAAIAFVFHWGNYLDALLYAQFEDVRTLPVGLAELIDLDGSDQPVVFAAVVLLAGPALAALLLLQRSLLGSRDLAGRR